jgi:hypothetical protein
MVIDALMARYRRMLVVLRHVSHETAILVNVFIEQAAHIAMVNVHRTYFAAALNEAQNMAVGPFAARRPLSLARISQRGFVSFHSHASATERASVRSRSHRKANAVAKVPSGFHAAAEHPLKLAGGNTFLAGAKQMDRLKPKAQPKLAILENGAHADSEGFPAAVALAQTRTGSFASQAADFVASGPTMRANRTVRPKPSLDILESGFLTVEMGGGKDRAGHRNLLQPQLYIERMGMSSETSPKNIP